MPQFEIRKVEQVELIYTIEAETWEDAKRLGDAYTDEELGGCDDEELLGTDGVMYVKNLDTGAVEYQR